MAIIKGQIIGYHKYDVVDDKIFLQHPKSLNKMLIINDYGNKIEEYTWDSSQYFEVVDLAFLDSMNGIVVVKERYGNHNNIFFKTEDGGVTFNQINLPYDNYSNTFGFYLICSAKSTSKVEGFYIITGYTNDPLIISKDYGTSWMDFYLPEDNIIPGMLLFKNSEYGFGIFSNSYKIRAYYYRDYRSSGVNKDEFISAIKIFPNPTSSQITVSGIEASQYTIKDLSGRLVQNGIFEKTINIESLSKGVYILTIITDQQHYFKKVIVE
ncbi:MAG: T9SS type A sorting domain-containing protein [Bacteroidetes bacterium]|nr:T9SS type A sorting domain-containing protein [Bacteroidota bacterium]